MIEANFNIIQETERNELLYSFNVKEENPKDLFSIASKTFDEFLKYKGIQKVSIEENTSFKLQME